MQNIETKKKRKEIKATKKKLKIADEKKKNKKICFVEMISN